MTITKPENHLDIRVKRLEKLVCRMKNLLQKNMIDPEWLDA